MRPLPNKTRISILVFLIFVFLIITPVLVAYSLGYRVSDIDDVFTLEKTGGVYIHSNISNTQVYSDGEFVKANGVLLRNTLIQNLRPGTSHKVEVHKEGYNSWIKELPVYSSLVTEGRVLMIPKEIPSREIFPFVDANGQGTTTVPAKTVFVKSKPVPNNSEYRNLMTLFEGKDIYATSTTVSVVKSLNTTSATSTATTTKDLPKYFVDLGIKDPSLLKNLIENGEEIAWLDAGNIILNWVGKDNSEIPYYYCVEPESCDARIVLDWGDFIKKFNFLPGRNDVFLVWVDSGLYAVEADGRSQRNIQPIYTENMTDFIIGPNNKIFIRNKDAFFELTI